MGLNCDWRLCWCTPPAPTPSPPPTSACRCGTQREGDGAETSPRRIALQLPPLTEATSPSQPPGVGGGRWGIEGGGVRVWEGGGVYTDNQQPKDSSKLEWRRLVNVFSQNARWPLRFGGGFKGAPPRWTPSPSLAGWLAGWCGSRVPSLLNILSSGR